MLLENRQTLFPQPVGQTVLINFFQMPVVLIILQLERRLPHLITQRKNVSVVFRFHFATFAPFCS